MERHIIVCGAPLLRRNDEAKLKKFLSYFEKKISKETSIREKSYTLSFFYNEDDTVGGCFMAFDRRMNAENALKELNGLEISKNVCLKTYRWGELNNTAMIEEKYVPPSFDDEEETEADLTNTMMTDPDARPQVMLKVDDKEADTVIRWMWINWRTSAKLVLENYRVAAASREDRIASWTAYDRDLWRTRSASNRSGVWHSLPMWSPYGTYLVTAFKKGISLWAGRKMNEVLTVRNDNISNVTFSPDENYLLVQTKDSVDVWMIRQGKRLRSFEHNPEEKTPIKFNSDDTLFSIVIKGSLSIFDSVTGELVRGNDENSTCTMQSDSLLNAVWSPGSPYKLAIVHYEELTGYRVEICNLNVTYEQKGLNKVAVGVDFEPIIRRNFLSATPPFNSFDPRWKKLSEEELEEVQREYKKYRFDVLWHPRGEYIAAKMGIVKSRNTMKFEYALMRVGEKTASIEQVAIEGTPIRFNWQNAGNYFAAIVDTGESETDVDRLRGKTQKYLQIYSLKARGGIRKICSVPTEGNRILWSPNTPRIATVNFDISYVEVFGIDDKDKVKSYGRREHAYINNAEWDPSGRYFFTWTGFEAVDNTGRGENNQLMIGDMNNKVLHVERYLSNDGKRLHRVIFRPAARLAIGPQELKKINNDLPSYIKDCHEDEIRKRIDNESKMKEKLEKEETQFKDTMNAIYAWHKSMGFFEKRREQRRSAPACIQREKEGIVLA